MCKDIHWCDRKKNNSIWVEKEVGIYKGMQKRQRKRTMMTTCVFSQWTKCRIISRKEKKKEREMFFYHALLIVYVKSYS